MVPTASPAIESFRARPEAADEGPTPLENGDRLTRPEFERRYEATPHVKKAQLIEGTVYMPSPVRRQHGRPHGHIVSWLGVYEASTPGVELADNTTVRLDLDNEPQPDVLLRITEGGSSRISEDDYIEGPPELMVEVASSSAAIDLYDKKEAYRRNGAQEYLVWVIRNREVRWFVLRNGSYERLEPDAEGVLRSGVFPGLWLDAAALLEGSLQKVLACLAQGLASPEHAAFKQRLASGAAPPPAAAG